MVDSRHMHRHRALALAVLMVLVELDGCGTREELLRATLVIEPGLLRQARRGHGAHFGEGGRGKSRCEACRAGVSCVADREL